MRFLFTLCLLGCCLCSGDLPIVFELFGVEVSIFVKELHKVLFDEVWLILCKEAKVFPSIVIFSVIFPLNEELNISFVKVNSVVSYAFDFVFYFFFNLFWLPPTFLLGLRFCPFILSWCSFSFMNLS
jgi:hypothetical protein